MWSATRPTARCLLSSTFRLTQGNRLQHLHRLIPDRPFTPTSKSYIYKVDEKSGYFQPLREWMKRNLLPLLTKMDTNQTTETVFAPPETVRGMKVLDRKLFSCSVKVPCLSVKSQQIGALTKGLRMSMFKMPRIKPVAELPDSDPERKTHRLFLLDPRKYQSADDFSPEEVEKLRNCDVDASKLSFYEIELGYENWTAAEILRAVLPAESEGVSSYSIIGHIAHLNLKPEVMDYKHLIGEVILDKNHIVKTVVNKLNTIDNTFRNFQMELLAGEENYVTRTKENGCTFELDFSKVYWNPRLSTEHQRIVDCLHKGDVLYDVFAGIGPFAIPAAKKGVSVLANDLNPHSHSALVNNIKINKVRTGLVQTFNLDGREFIRTVLKGDLVSRLQSVAGVKEESAEKKEEENGKAASAVKTGKDEVASEGKVEKTVEENSSESLQGQITSVSKDDMSRTSDSGDTGYLPPSAAAESSSKGREVSCVGSGTTSLTKTEDSNSKAAETSAQNSSIPAPTEKADIQKNYRISVVMNLPALALEFLDAFPSLLSDVPHQLKEDPRVLDYLPTVYCYCFSKSDNPESDVHNRAEDILKHKLPSDTVVRLVRNVAPNKEMMCLIFKLTPEIVFGSSVGAEESGMVQESANDEPASKKQRVS